MKQAIKRARERAQGRRTGEGGFTLIELLIVIAIMAVLAAVVAVTLTQFTGNGQKEACKSTRETVETAAGSYRANTGNEPASLGALIPDYMKKPGSDWTTVGNTMTFTKTGATVTLLVDAAGPPQVVAPDAATGEWTTVNGNCA